MDKQLEELYRRPVRTSVALPGLAVFEREVRRFLAVPVQTIAGPIGNSLLFFAIFHFSVGRVGGNAALLPYGLDYVLFLIPGVMAMEVVNASFQNPVSSMLIAKWSGTIADQLIAPLSPLATWLAYAAGAAVRAFIVAVAAYVTGSVFAGNFHLHSPLLFVLSLLCTALTFAGLGMTAGVLCKSFDQVSMIGTFLLQPLVFLSGVFFTFESLPESVRWLPYANPIFYIVNAFRQSILGVGEIGPLLAIGVTFCFALTMGTIALVILKRGTGMRT